MPSQDPNFLERFQIFLEGKNRKNQDDVPKCNILLIGRTGIGKSTLINSIFRVDLAPAAAGKPVTGQLTKYSQSGCPIIAFDSRGLELTKEGQLSPGDINQNIQDVEALITGNHEKFPQEKIHIIYYCISPQNPRFEDVEESWVNSLMQFKIPIILVMTKAIEPPEESEFFKYFQERENNGRTEENGTGELDPLIRCVTKAEEIVQDRNKIPVVPVLAKSSKVVGGYEIPPYNLDLLVTQTASLLEDQPRQSFISQQIASIDLKVKQSQQLVSIYTLGMSGVSGFPGPTEAIIPAGHQLMLEQISSIFGLTDEEQDSLLKSEKFQELLGVTVASSVSSLIAYYIPIFGQIQSVVVTGVSTSTLGLAWIEVLKHRYSKLVENQTLSPEDIQTFIDDFVEEYKKYCDGIG